MMCVMGAAWDQLNQRIVACDRCERLREHCTKVAVEKRAAFREWTYWGKPVPNLGPVNARILIVGLAPAAHGANRTGRMFTGDRSGDFLFAALHRAGLATQPEATSRDDGLQLIDCAITAAAHCAPPGNKPTRDELAACSGYLDDTITEMSKLKAVLCLGGIGLTAAHEAYVRRGWAEARPKPKFAHGAELRFGDTAPPIFCSYHVSQQNTFTGRLTEAMFDAVLGRLKRASGIG